jgi:hypothetical protein
MPHPFFSQLVVLELLYLCVMLHDAWPSRGAGAQPRPTRPINGCGRHGPPSKVRLTVEVGEHTLAMAQYVGHQVAQLLAPDCPPLFVTERCKEDMTALLTHYGQWRHPPRQRVQGPAPKPRWMPPPQLM